MPDDKLAPKPQPVKITGKPNTSALHARMNQAAEVQKAQAQADPLVVPNRIAIIADGSGSMGGYKNRCLRDALQGFFNMCNFTDTSCSVHTFGMNPEINHNLSRDKNMLVMTAMVIQAAGGTPMHKPMRLVLEGVALTRAIIISDGDADNDRFALDQAARYAEQEIPIDTVHIGDSSGGEDLLKQIAKLTGGIYIKFDNVGNFATAFSYLTPAKRGELAQGIAGLLGAKEIIT